MRFTEGFLSDIISIVFAIFPFPSPPSLCALPKVGEKCDSPGYLAPARARARARAPGPPELGASGPYPEGEGGSSRWRARFYFLLYKCKIYAKNHVFIKAKLIEFRLQFRHPPSLRSPIWSFFLRYKCTYIRKNNVFISANLIEFRLQFRHPLSFRSPIW